MSCESHPYFSQILHIDPILDKIATKLSIKKDNFTGLSGITSKSPIVKNR